jgi:hypothetical protein
MPVGYVGKAARSSPAQGSAAFHKREQAAIVRSAFKEAEESEEAREREVERAG